MEKIQTRINYSSSSLSSSKFAAAYICFVKTGLVDRLDRPPGMMLDASTSSPDKSSMTSGFSESESTVFFFFCFLSFFCFFFGRSSSSSVLSASSCSSQSPRRSKVSLKVVGFSIIARLDTKMHKWREREIPISSSSKRRLCFTKKQREQKDERTNARRFRNSSHLLLLLLFFLDFFRKVPFGLRTLALQHDSHFLEFLRNNFQKEKMIEKKNTQKSIQTDLHFYLFFVFKERERERERCLLPKTASATAANRSR